MTGYLLIADCIRILNCSTSHQSNVLIIRHEFIMGLSLITIKEMVGHFLIQTVAAFTRIGRKTIFL
jgi:hypothetical protein